MLICTRSNELNVTRSSELPVVLLTTGFGSPSVSVTYSGLVLPGDEIRLQIKAGAVTSAIGASNLLTERTFVYGPPLQIMQQKLSEPDTDGSGIHMNEIVAYLNSAYGMSGLNDDALFNSKDILLVLDQIGLLLAR